MMEKAEKKNYWSQGMWEVDKACLYWCGFPIDLVLRDLIELNKRFFSSALEQNKIHAKSLRVLELKEIILNAAEQERIHVYTDQGTMLITPHEFTRFMLAQKKLPVRSVFKNDLLIMPPWIRLPICEIIQSRPAPILAMKFYENTSRSLAMSHKDEIANEGLRIYQDVCARIGRALTPKQILQRSEMKGALKRLHDPAKPGALVTYAERRVLGWISTYLPQLKRGRPSIAKSKTAKNFKNTKN